MPAEVVGKNIGTGRLNRWLLKIIGPASVGTGPRDGGSDAGASQEPARTEVAQPQP